MVTHRVTMLEAVNTVCATRANKNITDCCLFTKLSSKVVHINRRQTCA